MLRKILIISIMLAALTIVTSNSMAAEHENKWYVPESVVSQMGGYVGYASIGGGYRPSKMWQTDLIFGYVPTSIAGHEIYQLTWKNNVQPFEITLGQYTIKPSYLGISMIYGFGKGLFILVPNRYPDYYYPPTALRFTLNMGIEVIKDNHSLYAEATALDTTIEAYDKSPGYISTDDLLTLALGYRYYLKD